MRKMSYFYTLKNKAKSLRSEIKGLLGHFLPKTGW